MDLILHYKVYGRGIDKEVIPEYTKYFEPYYLSYIIKDYIRRARFKIKS